MSKLVLPLPVGPTIMLNAPRLKMSSSGIRREKRDDGVLEPSALISRDQLKSALRMPRVAGSGAAVAVLSSCVAYSSSNSV